MGNKQAQPKVSTELTEKQIAALKANTQFTEKEIREWHNGFMRDCPSGKLDKRQFVQIYSQFYPHGKADHYCKYAFNTFDIDRNGFIDFDEFLLTISTTSQGDLEDRLAIAFKLYDISGDGLIDQKELTILLTAMYDLVGENDRSGDRDPKKRAAQIIKQLDVNGDQKLNRDEFIAGCKNDSVIRQLLAPNI